MVGGTRFWGGCLALATLASPAEAFGADIECRWQRQAAGPAAVPLVAETGYTLRRAQEALAAVSRLVRPGQAVTHSAVDAYRREIGYVTGYVLTARLADARARRQHDADELVDLCEHWGMHALNVDARTIRQ